MARTEPLDVLRARWLLEQVPRDHPEVPLTIADRDTVAAGRFCQALAQVSPDRPPVIDVAAGNVAILLAQIGNRHLDDSERARVAILVRRSLVDLEEAVDEPDPRLRLTLLIMAAEPLLSASVDAATNRRWALAGLRRRRGRHTFRFRRPARPALIRHPRCEARRRPRSSRGPPDDDEDPEPHEGRWRPGWAPADGEGA